MFREMPVPTIFVLGFSTGFLNGCLCLMDCVFGLRCQDIGEIELEEERKKKANVFQCLREILILALILGFRLGKWRCLLTLV